MSFKKKLTVTTRVLTRSCAVIGTLSLFGCPVSSLEKEEIANIAATFHAEGGTGLRTEYYDVNVTPVRDNLFTKNSVKVATATATEINIDIQNEGAVAPHASLGTNSTYGIRWTGYFVPPKTGNYYLCTCSDDGIRVLLDGNHVIDGASYNDQGDRFWGSPNLSLEANRPYPIRVDYFQSGGGARAQLFFAYNNGASSWQNVCTAKNNDGTDTFSCDTALQSRINPDLQRVTKNFLVPANGSADAELASCYPPSVTLSEAEKADAADPDVQKALRLFDRLSGTKTTIYDPRVKNVAALIKSGRLKEAARTVSEDNGFLDITVRKFAAKMSTRAQVADVPLNDFIATVAGVTRDRVDARQLLVGNFLYRGKESLFYKDNDLYNVQALLKSNDHYNQVEGTGVPLKCSLASLNRDNLDSLPNGFEQKLFVPPGGSQVNPDPGGVITSRAFAEAHFIAGTNRRMREKIYEHFLCAPKDSIRTTEVSDMYVRRDVERFPSGPNSLNQFRNECASCHASMDAEAGAFAAYHFENGVLKYAPFYIRNGTNAMNETEGTMKLTDVRNNITNPTLNTNGGNPVIPDINENFGNNGTKYPVAWKMNHNVIYPDGAITTDSKWVNLFADTTLGSQFGFIDRSGEGVREYGRMIARSQAFPQCMAKKVFYEVCRQDPFERGFSPALTAYLESVGDAFASGGYDLRDLFETLAVSCL